MIRMTLHEKRLTRIDASTRAQWHGRGYTLPPHRWNEALAAPGVAGGETDRPAEVRATPAALAGLDTAALLAAARLRDAGIGLALEGAGKADGFRWLRALPWSAVIVHPALVAQDDDDRRRVLGRWAEAVRGRGMALVAPRGRAAELGHLHGAGFTHLELAG